MFTMGGLLICLAPGPVPGVAATEQREVDGLQAPGANRGTTTQMVHYANEPQAPATG